MPKYLILLIELTQIQNQIIFKINKLKPKNKLINNFLNYINENNFFFIHIVLLFFLSNQNIAQIIVTGNVTDTGNNKPISDVNIILKENINIVAKTNDERSFKLEIPKNSSKTLIFSHEDFDKKEILIEDEIEITVKMSSNIRYNAYGKQVTRKELNAEARNGILVLESKKQDYRFWFDSRIFFDGAYFFDKNALNPIGNGVNIRRARFALKANLSKYWYGELDLDFAYSKVELKDAFIKYQRKHWNVKAGNFKEGFSMQTTTTSRYQTFIERSLVSKFAPSRHLGLQTNIFAKHFLAVAGVHFQDIGDSESVAYSQSVNKQDGTDEGVSYTGRLVFMPIQNKNAVLHFGANTSFRTPKTSEEIPNSYRFSTRSLTSINRKKYLDTDDILEIKNRELYDFEIAGSWKQFVFQGEYMINKINKSNDFDAEIYGGSAGTYTAGITYHANNNVKLMLNYSFLNHDRYSNAKGNLNIYKDNAGNLYTDPLLIAIPAGEGGDDFGFISVRIEVDF